MPAVTSDTGTGLPEPFLVSQRLTGRPGLVFIGKVHSIPERRMAPPPHAVKQARTRHGQISLLQPDESSGCRPVVPGELEGKSVGLAFLVPAECQNQWRG